MSPPGNFGDYRVGTESTPTLLTMSIHRALLSTYEPPRNNVF